MVIELLVQEVVPAVFTVVAVVVVDVFVVLVNGIDVVVAGSAVVDVDLLVSVEVVVVPITAMVTERKSGIERGKRANLSNKLIFFKLHLSIVGPLR